MWTSGPGLQFKTVFIVSHSVDSFLNLTISCFVYKMSENNYLNNWFDLSNSPKPRDIQVTFLYDKEKPDIEEAGTRKSAWHFCLKNY